MIESQRLQGLTLEDVQEFHEKGVLGPVSLFSTRQCWRLRRALLRPPAPLDWLKGHAATTWAYHAIASHPAIVDRVQDLIGENVMLWGASLIRRRPGQVHIWHTDIETSAQAEGTVSVWIGLKNTTADTSLDVVPYSHRFGMSVQERAHAAGVARNQIDTEAIAAWSKDLDDRSGPVRLPAADGDAVIFDGRLWHGSHNTSAEDNRIALLLQYARPDRPIRMPDPEHLEFPFRFLEEPRPPCVIVRGAALDSTNRIEPGAVHPPEIFSPSWIEALELPLAEDESTGFASHRLFKGTTPCLSDLESHVSVLSPGQTPHPPHEHPEDELLVMLSGEAQLTIEDGAERRTELVRRGDFAFYSSGQQRHTIEASSGEPATYLMLRWQNPRPTARASRASSGRGLQVRRRSLFFRCGD